MADWARRCLRRQGEAGRAYRPWVGQSSPEQHLQSTFAVN